MLSERGGEGGRKEAIISSSWAPRQTMVLGQSLLKIQLIEIIVKQVVCPQEIKGKIYRISSVLLPASD